MRNALILSLLFLFACQESDLSTRDAKVGLATKVSAPSPILVAHNNPALKSRRMYRDTSVNDLFPTIPMDTYDSIFRENYTFFSDGFDYPVGKPHAKQYFLAQHFGDNKHLGEDWNGVGGGDTDLGDPVYAVANGLVTFSKEVCCGWGKVIRIAHRLPGHPEHDYVESVYAHLNTIHIKPGDLVRRGDKIGSIGTANGRYTAHLHLEIRSFINMSLGPGYSGDTFGYLNPSNFIAKNRPQH